MGDMADYALDCAADDEDAFFAAQARGASSQEMFDEGFINEDGSVNHPTNWNRPYNRPVPAVLEPDDSFEQKVKRPLLAEIERLMTRVESGESVGCPACSGSLGIRDGKFGRFLFCQDNCGFSISNTFMSDGKNSCPIERL